MTIERNTIDRREAARLLRVARAAGAADDGEAIDWALAALPESRHVRRLKVDQLLGAGDFEGADALIAAGLRRSPDDRGLLIMSARSLETRGRRSEAEARLRHVLDRWPDCVSATRMAARIARRLGRADDAAVLLRRLLQRRPGDESIRHDLVDALVDAGDPQAATIAASLREPTCLLWARVLRAQGQHAEACDLLEETLEATTDVPDREAALVELIDLLEEAGDPRRLLAALGRIDRRGPDVAFRAARALLAFGEFDEARRLAGEAGPAESSMIGIVISAAEERAADVHTNLDRLRRASETPDPMMMADLWRRVLLGTTLRNQASATQAAPEGEPGILPRLLDEAARTLQAELSDEGLGPAERRTMERYRGVCLAALGRTRQALDSFARAAETESGPAASRAAA